MGDVVGEGVFEETGGRVKAEVGVGEGAGEGVLGRCRCCTWFR